MSYNPIPVHHRSIAFVVVALCLVVFGWSTVGRGRAFLAGGDPWLDAGVPTTSDASVVIAELFTSEGCSSCPPADAVLSRLIREPSGGTVVLGLGEHVDYWDRLGWKDAFSSPAFSSRQSEYQRQVFRTESVYTPQLVIDGQFQAIGSDVSSVRRAIASAARIPKLDLKMTAWPADAGHVGVHVLLQATSGVDVHEESDVVVALTQDRLASDVRRGENRGRKLAHSAVVRSFTALGSITPPIRTFDKTMTLPIAADWMIDDVRIVGLLQERRSRRIVGAGSARIDKHGGPPSAG